MSVRMRTPSDGLFACGTSIVSDMMTAAFFYVFSTTSGLLLLSLDPVTSALPPPLRQPFTVRCESPCFGTFSICETIPAFQLPIATSQGSYTGGGLGRLFFLLSLSPSGFMEVLITRHADGAWSMSHLYRTQHNNSFSASLPLTLLLTHTHSAHVHSGAP